MTKAEQIKNKLKGLHDKGHYNTSAVIIGTVNAVNGIDTIDVDVDGVLYNDVQLQAIEEGNGKSVILVPTKGSNVLIGNIENGTNYVLLHANKVDRILLKQVDGMFIDIVKGAVKLNGDEFEGLVKVKDLTDKINALEKDLNKLKTVFSSWTPVAQDGGAVLKGLSASWSGQILNLTLQQDLENTKVKHGG